MINNDYTNKSYLFKHVDEANYETSPKRINDLLHTELKVKFDWEKQYLYGKANLQLSPYFYPSDSLLLDAKGFEINKVSLSKGDSLVALNYSYNSLKLNIRLDRKYTKDEKYNIVIDYIAKPNELSTRGNIVITNDRGLYFVNPKGEEKNKPRQIWTQGEIESSSCWFPTIDVPNEKTTQEIYITVDTNFITLSNGVLMSSVVNNNGTKTDYWKQDLPHSPYLFMMVVGEYVVVKDNWKDMEVNYYVEAAYAKYAKQIFGNTPEMLEFYSDLLGVDYPWQKYAQVVVRDFVTGAMENTTATIHFEKMQRSSRELLDKTYENYIAHELFHQWFGNLVTCESWANLPLNESFATYGAYLWNEYKYGKEEADYHFEKDLKKYLSESENKQEPLIRFYYDAKEDMFDAHSYQKGSRILHMLRDYVGDEAFFNSLKLYLETNRFKSAEIHHLRLAFEEITGEDLNWFFNQWFLNAGHPKLKINYEYTDSTARVYISQIPGREKATLFKLPIVVDIYIGEEKKRHHVIVNEEEEAFTFRISSKPDLINVDANKILLCEKEDNKSTENFLYQYYHAPLFLDRYEAVKYFAGVKIENSVTSKVFLDAVNDKFWAIRLFAIKEIVAEDSLIRKELENKLVQLIKNDKKAIVRVEAIKKLSEMKNEQLIKVFKAAVGDSSYTVASTALLALHKIAPHEALNLANSFEGEVNEKIIIARATIYSNYDSVRYNAFYQSMINYSGKVLKSRIMFHYKNYLLNMKDLDVIEQSIESIVQVANANKTGVMRLIVINTLNDIKAALEKKVKQNTDKKINEILTYLEKAIKKLREKEY